MAVFKQGDMFRASGFIIISANSSLTSKGELMMDQDAKRKLSKRVSGIDRIFGQMILETCGISAYTDYSFTENMESSRSGMAVIRKLI